jgi:16S rRNA G527 N7-methylase RsmG
VQADKLAKEKTKLIWYEEQLAEITKKTNLVKNAVETYEKNLLDSEARLEASQRARLDLIKKLWN